MSFRSQVKLIPVEGSSVASEGKLGRRHPDSVGIDKYESDLKRPPGRNFD